MLEWEKGESQLEARAFPAALPKLPSSCPSLFLVWMVQRAQASGWSYSNACLEAKVETEFAIIFRESQDSLMFAKDKVKALPFLR